MKEKYVVILEDIIKRNSLTDFDKANLLPTKLKKGIALQEFSFQYSAMTY